MIAELNEWIGNDSRELRNSLILAELNNKAKTAIENHDDIKDAINETLNTENAKHACYVTNQSGFNLLDKMKDTDGNYILQPVVGEPTKKQIGGKIVHVYDNSILPNDETVGVKAPLIIGDLEMAIVMFDRQVVTVKTSTEGKDAFENDLTLMRALEREDVQTLDDEAFVYGQLTIS
jgi:HK97 family phage major capsid protein